VREIWIRLRQVHEPSLPHRRRAPTSHGFELVHLFTPDIAPEHRRQGTYMFEALKYRDQWQPVAADLCLVASVLRGEAAEPHVRRLFTRS
jgi:hypothetical protein